MTSADDDCPFCQIVAGDVPATVLATTDSAVAFEDLNPQAPLHALVIPKAHHVNAAELASAEPATVAELIRTADEVAKDAGHPEYRLAFNSGASVGQSVFHVHLHVLAGRSFTWPPG